MTRAEVPGAPLWGALQHHDEACFACDGLGKDEDGDACDECGGAGKDFWGSFYLEDHSLCRLCKRDDVPVSAKFEGGQGWACFRCYVAAHKHVCGCDAWAWADAMTPDEHDAAEAATRAP